MEYFTNSVLWNALRPGDKEYPTNGKLLRAASPIASGTMTAFSKEKPLCDLADKNGIVFVEGTYNGITGRYGGFSLDQAVKAGFVVDKPGGLFVAQSNYAVVDDGGMNYTIKFSIETPEQLREIMGVFFSPDSQYENDQLRQVDPKFGLPLGNFSSSGPDGKNLYLYVSPRPGSAVPGVYFDYSRFVADLGVGIWRVDGRFGGVTSENTGAIAPATKILTSDRAEFLTALDKVSDERAKATILAYVNGLKQ